MNAKEAREKLVKTAKSYKGALQGDKEHRKLIDVFNTIKPDGWAMTYTAYWCAAASSAWAIIAFGKDLAKKYFPLSANCGTIIDKAKRMKIWKEKDSYKPQAGDWILYDWQDSGYGENTGSPDHVGTVTSVKSGKIHVIEGNKHKAVAARELAVNGRYIRGFVTPDFAAIAKALTPKKKAEKEPEKKAKKKPEKKAEKKPAKNTEKKTEYYTVKKGDTLSAIAKKHGTTWQRLAKLNNLKDANIIHVGQRLKVK